MEQEHKKPKFIKMKIAGGALSVIPPGITELMTIEVRDEFAFFHFQDCKITKAFAERQNQDKVESKYNERLKKTACKYPGMSQDQILKHISERIQELRKK